VWLGLLALAGAAAVALRDPALVAPVAWAALWRAARGDGVAAAACAAGTAAGLAAGLAWPWPGPRPAGGGGVNPWAPCPPCLGRGVAS